MFEIKVTIDAENIVNAINNLANAILGQKTRTPQPAQSTPVIVPNPIQQQTPQPSMVPQQPQNAPQLPTITQPVVQATSQIPPTKQPVQPIPQIVPTSAPNYTLDMLANAGASLVDAGKKDSLTALLSKYGVNSITNINPVQYSALAADLRALGAKI